MTPFWNHFFEMFYACCCMVAAMGGAIIAFASLIPFPERTCAGKALSVLGLLFAVILFIFAVPFFYVASEYHGAIRKNPPAAEAKP